MTYNEVDFSLWKLEAGQKAELHGMIESPERNGEIVTIFGFRPVMPIIIDGYWTSGRAYYILEDGPGHYIYEERLREIKIIKGGNNDVSD